MLTLICIGNHEHRHPDGSPGGQARIFHLVKPHHGSFGRELVCRLSFFPFSRPSSFDARTTSQSVKVIVIASEFYGLLSGAWLSLFISELALFALRPTEIGLRTGALSG